MEEVKVPEVQKSEVQMSEQIGDLALALSKAQGEIEAVSKDEKGYGYNYASLASTIEASRQALTKNELSVVQLVLESDEKKARVHTRVVHSSGQYIGSTSAFEIVEMNGVNSVQKFGATLSYARRYTLQAILNMASEDNDASSKGFSGKINTSSIPSKVVNKPTAKAGEPKEEKKGSFRISKAQPKMKEVAKTGDDL